MECEAQKERYQFRILWQKMVTNVIFFFVTKKNWMQRDNFFSTSGKKNVNAKEIQILIQKKIWMQKQKKYECKRQINCNAKNRTNLNAKKCEC